MLRTALILLLTSSVAFAQEDKESEAKKWFIKSSHAFSQKKYDQAASHMRKAYHLVKKPKVIYNIALSVDKLGRCGEALYEYQRFLFLSDLAQKQVVAEKASIAFERTLVLQRTCPASDDSVESYGRLKQAWTAHNDNKCRDAIDHYNKYISQGKVKGRLDQAKAEIARLEPGCPKRPPPPPEESLETSKLYDQCEIGDDDTCHGQRLACRNYLKKDDAQRKDGARDKLSELNSQCRTKITQRPWSVRISGGVGKPSFESAETTLVGAVQLEVRYWLSKNKLRFGGSIVSGMTPIQFDTVGANPSTELSFVIDALVAGSVGYSLSDNFNVHGSVGAGFSFWTGLVTDNPFTVGAQSVSGGALSMLAFSFDVGIDYHFNDRIAAVLSANYTLNPGLTSKGLRSSSLNRISGLGGLRFRF